MKQIKTPVRKERAIRDWMIDRRWTVKLIAGKAGNIHQSRVSSTIGGSRNDRKTLRALVKLDCPLSYLGLPIDLVSWAKKYRRARRNGKI